MINGIKYDEEEQNELTPYVSPTRIMHYKRLVDPPPRTISCHYDKEEVIIHILDKSFGDDKLRDEYVYQMQELFKD